MIKIDECFEFERDRYGWKLHEWRAGTNKDGEPTRSKRTTYHPTLKTVLAYALDLYAGEASGIKNMLDALDIATAKLEESAARVDV